MENLLGTYLTATEIAKALKISRSGVYTLVQRGILPPGLLLGGSRRWELSALQQALAAVTRKVGEIR